MSDFNYASKIRGTSIFYFFALPPFMVRSPLDTIAGNDAAKLRISRLRPDSGAARGTGHAAAAPAVIRTSCMLCRCAWDW
jgi:hypothetical protein